MVFKQIQLILILVVMNLVLAKASFDDNCSQIFTFDYNERGKVNTGLIGVVVPKKLVDTGFELEVLFELDSFPLVVSETSYLANNSINF